MEKSDIIKITLKQYLFIFVFFVIHYAFILILFCKEHLSTYVSEDLLKIIMLSIDSIGATTAWFYVMHVKREIEKEKQTDI
jgi:hypothetical protein